MIIHFIPLYLHWYYWFSRFCALLKTSPNATYVSLVLRYRFVEMGNAKKVGSRRKCYKTKPCEPNVGELRHKSVSASRSKLCPNFSHYEQSTDNFQYDIIDMKMLESVHWNIAVCKYCHNSLRFTKKLKAGLESEFTVSCEGECEDSSFYNCSQVSVGLTESVQQPIPKKVML